MAVTLELLQKKLSSALCEKRVIFYNAFISGLGDYDWSMIIPNKKFEYLEKNRSSFYNSEQLKKNTDIYNWCESLKFFCTKIKNNGGILTGINPELMSCICDENFIKAAIEHLATKLNPSLQINFDRTNRKTDYSIIKLKKAYYFVFIKDFAIQSFNEIKIDENKREKYWDFIMSDNMNSTV